LRQLFSPLFKETFASNENHFPPAGFSAIIDVTNYSGAEVDDLREHQQASL
jgi:hypothetical protein